MDLPDELGPRIRQLRRRQGLTIQEVAKRAGVSRTSLSQIETGVANPSISTLTKIAEALGVWIGGLFLAGPEDVPRVHPPVPELGADAYLPPRSIDFVPRDRRKRLIMPWLNWSLELLTPDLWQRMQASMDTHEPGTELWHDSHEKEEFGIAIRGSFEMTVDAATYQLTEGDCVYLVRPPGFFIRLLSDEPGCILWVVTPTAR